MRSLKTAQTGWCGSSSRNDLLDQHHPVRSNKVASHRLLHVASTPPLLRRGCSFSCVCNSFTRSQSSPTGNRVSLLLPQLYLLHAPVAQLADEQRVFGTAIHGIHGTELLQGMAGRTECSIDFTVERQDVDF